MNRTPTRRQILKGFGIGAAATVLSACAPQVVEKVVKETVQVEVEKQVTTVIKETVAPEQPAAPGAVKISTMWTTGETNQQMVDTINTAFAEKFPNVFVEQVVAPWAEYEPKFMSMYAAGIAPDILGLGGTNQYVERFLRGVTLPLDEFAANDKAFIDDLWPICVRSYTINGHLVAIPMYVLPSGVWINSTRFDEAGIEYPPVDWNDKSWNWQAAIEVGRKLTLDKDYDSKLDQYGFDCGHWSPETLTRLWGQDLLSEEDYARGYALKLQTDKPEVKEALIAGLQARYDAIYKDKVMPSPMSASALWQMGSPLNTGAIAMEFTGGWQIDGVLPDEFEFRGAPDPGHDGNRMGITWASSLQINAKTKYPRECWEWVKFFCTDPEMVAYRAPLMGQTPSIRSAFDRFIEDMEKSKPQIKMTLEEKRTFFRGSAEQARTSCMCQIISGWAAARDTFSSILDALWLGERTVPEVVEEMIPQVNAKFEENAKQLGLI